MSEWINYGGDQFGGGFGWGDVATDSLGLPAAAVAEPLGPTVSSYDPQGSIGPLLSLAPVAPVDYSTLGFGYGNDATDALGIAPQLNSYQSGIEFGNSFFPPSRMTQQSPGIAAPVVTPPVTPIKDFKGMSFPEAYAYSKSLGMSDDIFKTGYNAANKTPTPPGKPWYQDYQLIGQYGILTTGLIGIYLNYRQTEKNNELQKKQLDPIYQASTQIAFNQRMAAAGYDPDGLPLTGPGSRAYAAETAAAASGANQGGGSVDTSHTTNPFA